MRDPIHSGWHLMMDATVNDAKAISSVEGLKQLLVDLVDCLKMEILDGPRMTEVELDQARLDTDSDEGGITGYCLITTSHISIHTWPLRKRFCLDLFSCKEFDGEAAVKLIRERLHVDQAQVHQLNRTWPAETPSARGCTVHPAG